MEGTGSSASNGSTPPGYPDDGSPGDGSPGAGPQAGGPPEDPDSWSDEQWIAWLDATDDPDAADDGHHPRHRRRGRPASMLGVAMLGMHDLIYGPGSNEIAIVVDAGGDPPGDDLPEVHLDPDHPERSQVIVHRDSTKPRPDPSQSPEDA